MRKFNYITDYSLINSSVNGYIIELEKELAMLIDMEEDNNIYIETYKKLKEFKNKYSDLYYIYKKIRNGCGKKRIYIKQRNVSCI